MARVYVSITNSPRCFHLRNKEVTAYPNPNVPPGEEFNMVDSIQLHWSAGFAKWSYRVFLQRIHSNAWGTFELSLNLVNAQSWFVSWYHVIPRGINKPTSFTHWLHHGSLQWRHDESHGVSNHLRLDCLLNRLFRQRSKKTIKIRVTGFCEGNPPVNGFPSQRASSPENGSIWWRHRDNSKCPWWNISWKRLPWSLAERHLTGWARR